MADDPKLNMGEDPKKERKDFDPDQKPEGVLYFGHRNSSDHDTDCLYIKGVFQRGKDEKIIIKDGKMRFMPREIGFKGTKYVTDGKLGLQDSPFLKETDDEKIFWRLEDEAHHTLVMTETHSLFMIPVWKDKDGLLKVDTTEERWKTNKDMGLDLSHIQFAVQGPVFPLKDKALFNDFREKDEPGIRISNIIKDYAKLREAVTSDIINTNPELSGDPVIARVRGSEQAGFTAKRFAFSENGMASILVDYSDNDKRGYPVNIKGSLQGNIVDNGDGTYAFQALAIRFQGYERPVIEQRFEATFPVDRNGNLMKIDKNDPILQKIKDGLLDAKKEQERKIKEERAPATKTTKLSMKEADEFHLGELPVPDRKIAKVQPKTGQRSTDL